MTPFTASVARGFAFLALGLGLAACGSIPDVERDPEPLTQTPALRYEIVRHDIAYTARVPYTFLNDTGVDVRLADCATDVRALLQVRRGDRWVEAWFPPEPRCEGPALIVAAGESYHDTLRVAGGPPGSNVTPAFIFEDVQGVYRLYWHQAAFEGDGSAVGDAARSDGPWRVSNPFVLAFR